MLMKIIYIWCLNSGGCYTPKHCWTKWKQTWCYWTSSVLVEYTMHAMNQSVLICTVKNIRGIHSNNGQHGNKNKPSKIHFTPINNEKCNCKHLSWYVSRIWYVNTINCNLVIFRKLKRRNGNTSQIKQGNHWQNK